MAALLSLKINKYGWREGGSSPLKAQRLSRWF